MKHLLHIIAVATLAFGLVACDQVVLPGGGTGGGTGGGNDPGDTTGSGGRDTSLVLEITGPVVDMFGDRAQAPEGSSVIVLWETGRRGTQLVYGRGTLNATNTAYVLRLSGPLPEEALFDPNGDGGVHGRGSIVLTDRVLADGDVITNTPNGMIPFIGMVQPFDVIYNTGLEKATPWTTPWLQNFQVGYSMARTAFTGWVPVEEERYPMVLLTR